MNKPESTKMTLYPYLSAKGPKSNDPDKIPKGKIENNVPNEIASSENFSRSPGAMEPNVISETPNSSIPRQAEKNMDRVDGIAWD
jgi:hypothetical protein